MTTLANIRAALNLEIGVTVDAETDPWSAAVRNQAIADGYADLWRVGIRKDAKQDLATNTDSWVYALTTIRSLSRLELLDSSSRIIDHPRGIIEPDGTGANTFQLMLTGPVSTGYTLRVRGYAPYISVFAGDSANDDLPVEHGRIPRLKAKAILYRQQLSLFARYGERQTIPPQMNMTIEQIVGVIANAEAEYQDAARRLSGLRPRAGQTRHL